LAILLEPLCLVLLIVFVKVAEKKEREIKERELN